MPRTARLSVMLSHEIKEELKGFAKATGMTESTLTAYIIGQWLATQRQVQKSLTGLLESPEMAKYVIQASADAGNPIVGTAPQATRGGDASQASGGRLP